MERFRNNTHDWIIEAPLFRKAPILRRKFDVCPVVWGDSREVEGFVPAAEITARNRLDFDDPLADIDNSMVLKGFFEHGLAKALCADKPVALRLRGRTYCAVAS